MRKVYLGTEEISDKLKLNGDRAEIPFPVYVDTLEIEYLLVGGGGGGANYYLSGDKVGAGGGAGEFKSGSFNLSPSQLLTYAIGGAGLGDEWDPPSGPGSCVGQNGYRTYIQGIASAASGSGAARYGGCGYGGFNTGAGYIGGGPNRGEAGGGGAGSIENGSDGTWPAYPSGPAFGGSGGDGIVTDFVYPNGSPIQGGAGGGGGAGGTGFTDVGGAGGIPGGGNGGAGSTPAENATTPGSGGGGAYYANSGAGGDGLLVFRYLADREVLTGFGTSYKVGNYWYHIDDIVSNNAQKTYTAPPRFLISI